VIPGIDGSRCLNPACGRDQDRRLPPIRWEDIKEFKNRIKEANEGPARSPRQARRGNPLDT
jgi:hypothetical protein